VNKRLTRNPNNKIVAGVASGLADYFGIDATIVRILFVLLLLPGGLSPLLYVLLWILMPERQPAQIIEHGTAEPYQYDPYTGEKIQR
jgi:phage shock protein C